VRGSGIICTNRCRLGVAALPVLPLVDAAREPTSRYQYA
jgi:hypothetical protein